MQRGVRHWVKRHVDFVCSLGCDARTALDGVYFRELPGTVQNEKHSSSRQLVSYIPSMRVPRQLIHTTTLLRRSAL